MNESNKNGPNPSHIIIDLIDCLGEFRLEKANSSKPVNTAEQKSDSLKQTPPKENSLIELYGIIYLNDFPNDMHYSEFTEIK